METVYPEASTDVLNAGSSVIDSARVAVEVAYEQNAMDVVIIDLSDCSDLTDYFVIATGYTARHLKSLEESIVRSLRRHRVRLIRREGSVKSGWTLLDFPGFIVHLMLSEQRERYALEQLWSKAGTVLYLE